MSNLKLTIDLLPKGAWGNNLSRILPKNDWDILRQKCYQRSNHTCAICGNKTDELDAHEVWDFDMKSKTQTLKDIIALCSRCHGVKHMRNSQRIGYGENAKRHFLNINQCNELAFAKHYLEAELLFDERNQILRWKLKADLGRFGGKGIEVEPRVIPIIVNPYDGVDWQVAGYSCKEIKETGDDVSLNSYARPPKIRSIDVDNYQGAIIVRADFANKIEWICDDRIIKTKFNSAGKLAAEFDVEDLEESQLRFVLTGQGGEIYSQEFGLMRSGA